MNSSTFEAGDIVIADFQFSDSAEVKRRPVLVLAQREGLMDVAALKITSINRQSRFDVLLEPSDLSGEHLKKTSYIVADFISTIGSTRVSRKVGKLSPSKLAEVRKRVREFLGL
ncbi:MAG: type II toxin-antitoxin system PemK/MazF family toxin [Candidatus Micrarchaeota archaeon]